MTYYLKAEKFLLENEEKMGGYLFIKDGKFGSFVSQIPEGATVVDYSGYTIAPGLFDTHIHGIKGHDIMDGEVEAINEISKTLLSLGVTRFLPTTLTSLKDDLDRAIIAIREAVENGLPGAQSEGIFLEGPYFTELHKGAQNSSYFRDPDVEEFQYWQQLADGSIKKIAIAPERQGVFDFIRKVTEEGVLVSIAHTNASFECCKEAVDAGARNYVHLFNGMTGLHHRTPGVVGAALVDDRAFAELICDGFHVHPDVSALALRIKDDKLILITDCMQAGLMPDGNYHLGEFSVVMKDGVAKLESGSLAGSTLKLIDGVKNLQEWSSESLYKIWHLGSLTPAVSLGKDTQLGSISPGKIADYVVLNNQFEVQATAVAGEVKYQK
ncbi:N-acetylglucosamine-6-phosphate deacetylase [Bacillus sp. REN16]|uniref:N-acetylglucosamine-6-phosphate deacetylase n=1 Tax=Bacillus sp. REN16 TaxID=2887296 RepID=UPI001E4244EB|nr:N-acetylglucosamine-6-phosphate deacetylase [Bacillus sp. REN16]MCC3355352.1 N-acetylglucosamine-6-phosphate deacetylase [Bacillus sp. REN16]